MCPSVEHHGTPGLHAQLRPPSEPHHRDCRDDIRREGQRHCCRQRHTRYAECHTGKISQGSSTNLA